ncbi:unnamed protein product [Rotaria magnacalcarata]|uniref:CUB domain-containing protein n=1 Tax=Rotaria magnacalcarata TaxID=392030 RepID=A0A814XKX3_9BILA|nr:unnamed protein product [Rotaria magnacalcarata]CAF2021562.1 unnamed protein product [Rotaria magnacalcarata]
MWSYFYLLLMICLNFNYVNTAENELKLYMDNQTLCNQEIINLKNIHRGRIYSHIDYHNKYFYFPDNHCTVTIKTKKRAWMSLEYFQSNSSSSFPRCTDAKYAGNDDRLQIIDGYKNGSILRIICGKDTDKFFDRTSLILKSSIFTIDWRTKSESFGFELKFVLYDLAIDGQCLNSDQFQCRNRRCIDKSLICYDEDSCGDGSHENSLEKQTLCAMKMSKPKLSHAHLIFFLIALCCCLFLCILIYCLKNCQKQIIQLLLLIVSKQAVMQPFDDVGDDHNEKVVQLCGCFFGKGPFEQVLFNNDNNDQAENMGENFLKLTKRRPRSKVNLVGLWSVPTQSAGKKCQYSFL